MLLLCSEWRENIPLWDLSDVGEGARLDDGEGARLWLNLGNPQLSSTATNQGSCQILTGQIPCMRAL